MTAHHCSTQYTNFLTLAKFKFVYIRTMHRFNYNKTLYIYLLLLLYHFNKEVEVHVTSKLTMCDDLLTTSLYQSIFYLHQYIVNISVVTHLLTLTWMVTCDPYLRINKSGSFKIFCLLCDA